MILPIQIVLTLHRSNSAFISDFLLQGFPSSSDGKESACNVGDLGSIPGLGRSPGGGHIPPPPPQNHNRGVMGPEPVRWSDSCCWRGWPLTRPRPAGKWMRAVLGALGRTGPGRGHRGLSCPSSPLVQGLHQPRGCSPPRPRAHLQCWACMGTLAPWPRHPDEPPWAGPAWALPVLAVGTAAVKLRPPGHV